MTYKFVLMEKYVAVVLVSVVCCACSTVKVLNAGTVGNADLSKFKTFSVSHVNASGDTKIEDVFSPEFHRY